MKLAIEAPYSAYFRRTLWHRDMAQPVAALSGRARHDPAQAPAGPPSLFEDPLLGPSFTGRLPMFRSHSYVDDKVLEMTGCSPMCLQL